MEQKRPADIFKELLDYLWDSLCLEEKGWKRLKKGDFKKKTKNGLIYQICFDRSCYNYIDYKIGHGNGQSFESLTTEHILGLVSQIRPDMVKELKTNGSGKLPKDIQSRKTEHFTASANDAFATIRINAKDSTENCYAEILDYLCAVLEQKEFPHSYSVEFRGKEKIYLPIPGLPKKGINQLFACAVQYPNLHTLIEKYARLAMKEVIALINRCIGGGYNWKGKFWEMKVVTLGVVFCDTGKVSTKEERLEWPVTEEERNGKNGWGRFQSEQICRLKIRRMKEEWAQNVVVRPWCITHES